MEPTTRPRVKICCISSVEEARLAVQCGASALGFVSAMPSGPGVLTEDLIAEIIATVPPAIGTFLLTSKTCAADIIAQQKYTHANTLQLVDSVEPGTYARLRDALPGIALVQVIHVLGPASLEEALSLAPQVDGLLLDSGNPTLAIKELGGTGRRHDWQISQGIREAVSRPLFLAGGLNPENVREAVQSVGPYGLDICSGVRTNGRLDETKLTHFFARLS